MNELFDTHAHLNDKRFDEDREAVLARAAERGVARIVEIADGPHEWEAALALARARPETLRCALGLHPYHADSWSPALEEELARKARLPEVVGIGEIGLDFVKAEVDPGVQRHAFVRLLDLAREWDKPVIIHCRGAYPDLLKILAERFSGPPQGRRYWGVVHCFSGEPPEAVECVRLGFAVGADGPVTYPKNDSLREAFRLAGPDATVLETDSPWLPPQSHRGKRNEPSGVVEVVERLAQVWGLSVDEAAARTTANALALYRLA